MGFLSANAAQSVRDYGKASSSDMMKQADDAGMGKTVVKCLRQDFNALTFKLDKDGDCYKITVTGYDELDCLELTRSAADACRTDATAIVTLFTPPHNATGANSGERSMVLRVQPMDVRSYLSARRKNVCRKFLFIFFIIGIALACNYLMLWKFSDSWAHSTMVDYQNQYQHPVQ